MKARKGEAEARRVLVSYAYGVVCQRRFEGRSKEEWQKLALGLLSRYGGTP